MVLISLIIIAAALCAAETVTAASNRVEKIPIHFSYITTITEGYGAAEGIPAVDLALEQINNRTDILPNYTLNYTTILDSKVSEKKLFILYLHV